MDAVDRGIRRPPDLLLDLDLLRALLDEIPHGVVLLDVDGRVVHYNRAEERLARRSRASVLGKSFFEDVAPCMNTAALAGRFRAQIGREPLDLATELRFPFPFLEGPRAVSLRLSSFDLAGRPYGCLFIQDVSAAHALAEMRESLTSMVVHDLKNPLAVIRANLDYLAEVPALAGDADALLSIEESGIAERRLHQMVLTLLDMARLEQGTMPVRRTPTDLGALLDAGVRQARPIARARPRAARCSPSSYRSHREGAMGLIQTIYASTATVPFGDQELRALLTGARARNTAVQVSGVLLYQAGTFLQVLEGADDHVLAVYQRICRDPRHREVLLLVRREIPERNLGDRSMGFVDVAGRAATLPGFRAGVALADLCGDAAMVERVVAGFRDGRWHRAIA